MDLNIITIRSNHQYGRYLVAVKDIKEGELILKESATVIGSRVDAFHICFRCNTPLKLRVQICKICNVATVCSHDCQGKHHKDSECTALKSSGLKAINIINSPEIILPLRCLLVKKYNEDLWIQLMLLEAHLENRRNTPIWNTHKRFVEEPLKNLNILTQQDLDQETIQKICGILDVNTFEVRPPFDNEIVQDNKDCLRGIYLQASLMTHDCIGNTLLSVDDDFTMTVYANRTIYAGETIFFNYSNCLNGSYERRRHLQEGKYFECICKRCSDSTELGTHMSSIKCSTCKDGLVTPTIPLTDVYETLWSCQACTTIYNGPVIKSTLDNISNKIAQLDLTNIPQTENLLKDLESSLPLEHYLILELKQNMISIYNRNLFNNWALTRIIQLCADIISVLKIIEPGLSRLQGLALYQLQSAQTSFANKRYQCKEITRFKYLDLLNEAQENLTSAIKHLLYEPKNSPEGRLTQHALNDLKILRNTIKEIKIICDSKLSEKDDILTNILPHKKKT